jgi:hypothetical protein
VWPPADRVRCCRRSREGERHEMVRIHTEIGVLWRRRRILNPSQSPQRAPTRGPISAGVGVMLPRSPYLGSATPHFAGSLRFANWKGAKKVTSECPTTRSLSSQCAFKQDCYPGFPRRRPIDGPAIFCVATRSRAARPLSVEGARAALLLMGEGEDAGGVPYFVLGGFGGSRTKKILNSGESRRW